jgi:YNFM family putative membrane transporter
VIFSRSIGAATLPAVRPTRARQAGTRASAAVRFRRRLIAVGLVAAALGLGVLLAPPLPLVVAGLVLLVLGTFTAQAIAPTFVNVNARTAKGGASALYLTSYYVGGTLGSVVPGFALQAAGWRGVVLSCAAALGVALLANALLCGRVPRGRAAG